MSSHITLTITANNEEELVRQLKRQLIIRDRKPTCKCNLMCNGKKSMNNHSGYYRYPADIRYCYKTVVREMIFAVCDPSMIPRDVERRLVEILMSTLPYWIDEWENAVDIDAALTDRHTQYVDDFFGIINRFIRHRPENALKTNMKAARKVLCDYIPEDLDNDHIFDYDIDLRWEFLTDPITAKRKLDEELDEMAEKRRIYYETLRGVV